MRMQITTVSDRKKHSMPKATTKPLGQEEEGRSSLRIHPELAISPDGQHLYVSDQDNHESQFTLARLFSKRLALPSDSTGAHCHFQWQLWWKIM